MRLAIIGGKLQGVEAAYLARKAGWQTLLIDKRANTPASGLCDETILADVCQPAVIQSVLTKVDLILPALENREALAALKKVQRELNCPIAFDFVANALSCSKSLSYALFGKLGLDMPKPFPECGFPLLVKPDSSSGSRGVTILENEADYRRFFGQTEQTAESWVGQQFIAGPSYSLEVIGRDGHYDTPQITEIHMDQGNDCKAVTAPTAISQELAEKLRCISLQLAHALNLCGIMDVEVIAQDDRLYLLEIDARLPSQTPIAVYWSQKTNMLELLADVYLPGTNNVVLKQAAPQHVRLEHIQVTDGVMTLAGEHLMGTAGPLATQEGFFGIQEAITDYVPGKKHWCATLIHTGVTAEELENRRMIGLAQIKASCGIIQVIDSKPTTRVHQGEACHDTVEIC
ncbi:3-methylornithine--L-lysine ligase PylC [Desulfobulbus rhabdoformis]|uniref:3-methylornithine--L-lysine ligase PylC n=1 Tax=Desulfobulbus rhabdoformis TaxID=34032 RepID=UPI001963BED1|nr:3-methylornithine--L-lysine ligase PylC [Desulfobulbus rhabdoformis]MBM9615899.1 3-methylornithine--L-lysine ligase PylC [Desulfobulbus rhabdoformis]